MRIGIDFDNTIVSSAGVFHRAAVERNLIPATTAVSKDAVRNALRAAGREDDWTELQGYVYGPGMDAATPYDGIMDFIHVCLECGSDIFIISHKTRYPYRGPHYDLHAAAKGWLKENGLMDSKNDGLDEARVFFELTKADKLARIGSLACDVFIDDLPEFLSEPAFPAGVRRVLFDPDDRHAQTADFPRIFSWSEAEEMVFDHGPEAA